VDAAISAGLAVDEFAPRLSFFFNAHNDLLEEIAKYRAARRLQPQVDAAQNRGRAEVLAQAPRFDHRLQHHPACMV
jgi:methylmalonyl-CoA mutase N-terminal domain/subunit